MAGDCAGGCARSPPQPLSKFDCNRRETEEDSSSSLSGGRDDDDEEEEEERAR